MSARPYRPTTLGPPTPEAQRTSRRRSSMVVPRGTAARREEENALLELEAALSACLHPPPSSVEPPTMKKPSLGAISSDTLTGALLVFPRQPPMLVADEPLRPLAHTQLMAPARVTPPPLPMATTLPFSASPPWQPTPLPFVPVTPSRSVELVAPMPVPAPVKRKRSRAKWLVMLVVLFAVTGVLAVRPVLRTRAKATAVVVGKQIVKGAVIAKAYGRRVLHR